MPLGTSWETAIHNRLGLRQQNHSDGRPRTERTSRPGERVRSGVSPSSTDPGRADPTDPGSEQRLLTRVQQGSASAVGVLFAREAPWLRRRASGRLPAWARSGGVATSDLVQDVLHHTFARLTWFESTHVSALRTYLRRAVENRVQDELRRAIRRLDLARLAPGEDPLRPFEDAAPQYQQCLQDELWGRRRADDDAATKEVQLVDGADHAIALEREELRPHRRVSDASRRLDDLVFVQLGAGHVRFIQQGP